MCNNRFFRAATYFPLYALCIALASALWRQPAILSTCFLAVSAFMLYRWHTRSDLAHFCLAFVLGPVGEFIAIHFGAWNYSAPALLIPFWLPLAWAISGLYLKKTTEALAERDQVSSTKERMAQNRFLA